MTDEEYERRMRRIGCYVPLITVFLLPVTVFLLLLIFVPWSTL